MLIRDLYQVRSIDRDTSAGAGFGDCQLLASIVGEPAPTILMVIHRTRYYAQNLNKLGFYTENDRCNDTFSYKNSVSASYKGDLVVVP